MLYLSNMSAFIVPCFLACWIRINISCVPVARTLLGDILIASGIIAYLGVFTSQYRKEACDGWLQKLSDLKIPASKEFSLSSLGKSCLMLFDRLDNIVYRL